MALYKCAGYRRLVEAEGDEGVEERPACDYEAKKPWTGSCPKCGRFYNCEKIGVESAKRKRVTAADALGVEIKRNATGIDAIDFVISGGIAVEPEAHAYLFAGEKGSGKTTLSAQMISSIAVKYDREVILVSAEEYTDANLALLNRIGRIDGRVEIVGCDAADDVHTAIEIARERKRAIAVFDSLQALKFLDMPASPKRDVAVAAVVNEYCKKTSTPCFLMNHMDKRLEAAGSTTVGHYVDTELFLYKYSERDDGRARTLFSEETLDRISLADVRTLIVGKIRGGQSGRKAFFLATERGLEPLELKPPKSPEDGERRSRRLRSV